MLPAKQAYFAVRTTIFSPAILDVENDRELGKSKKDSNGEVDGLNWKWGKGGQHPRCFHGHDRFISGALVKKTNKQTNKQKTYNRYVVLC